MSTAERSEIQYGLTIIPFLIRRSDRRGTVALTIEAPGKLVITAPSEASVDRLNNIVRNKARWVVRGLKRISDLPPAPGREFVTGEAVYYLGRQYRLKVVATEPSSRECSLRGRWLHVPVERRVPAHRRAKLVRHVLRGWLKDHADHYLPNRLALLCEGYGIPRPSMVVREQLRRWGSCDVRGTVRINWRIIQASPALIDYVLLHELVHLRHPNHTREFWAEVERQVPDFERRRRELKTVGPTLEW